MIPVITLRDSIVTRPPDPEPDHEVAYRLALAQGWSDDLAALYAAHAIGLAVVDGEGDAVHWTIGEVRHLIFLRQCDDRGEFTS